MKLTIHKHKNNTGKYFHKAPHGSDIRNTRSVTCKEITKYIEGNDDFYKNYLNEGHNPEKILETLDNHPIKNTKLYWLICRCLKDEPTERSLIYI